MTSPPTSPGRRSGSSIPRGASCSSSSSAAGTGSTHPPGTDPALDLGVNWIDTAAAYGFGRSEEVVGRAIEGLASKPYVFTKCSLLEGPGRRVVHNLKRDSVLREAEASLKRLRVDAIDLYQIHWPNPEADIEEGWAALAELKEQGLVRHIGVSNFDVAQMRRISSIAPVETLQPPYSLINRGAEAGILPYAEDHGIGVIVYSPMGSGLLTGKMTRDRIDGLPDDDWRKNDPDFTEPRLTRHLELVGRLTSVARRYGTTPGAVGVAWTLRNRRPAAPLSACAAPIRSPRSSPRPGWSSPTPTSARSRTAEGTHHDNHRSMNAETTTETHRPGRPRSEKARTAILRATAEL
ncbi:MAG TPA: aldo/keto reductase, partial [Streptosporangiaceae bacterium]|nr:aldo/keto reductase [Streptosporangiaceae bacterium]